MHRYTSGNALLEFDIIKTTETRKHCSFLITINGNEHYKFIGKNYDCPNSWTEEQIAIDMFGWGIDSCCDGDYDLYESVEFYEELKYREDIVKVNKR